MQNKASLSPLIVITALFAALSGLYLLGGGIWLAKLGGSLYYIIAGLVLLATSWLLFRRRATALLLYAVFLLGTTVWALWEVGPDFWALTPGSSLFFGLWLVLPFIYRKLVANGKFAYGAERGAGHHRHCAGLCRVQRSARDQRHPRRRAGTA